MPDLAVQPCLHPGCGEYAVQYGRCADHAPEVARVRGTTTARGLGARWRKLRAMKLRRQPLCEIQTHCGKGIGQKMPAVATTVDHVQPRSKRPDLCFVMSNLQSACKRCNEAKGNRE